MFGHLRRRWFSRSGSSVRILADKDTSFGSTSSFPNDDIISVLPHRFTRRDRRTTLMVILSSLGALWIHRSWPRAEHLPIATFMRLDQKTSYLLGYSLCPDSSQPIVPVDQIIGAKQTCVSIETANLDFIVDVCPVSAVCNSFSVRIRRTNQAECERLEGLEIPVQNETRAEWLRWSKGPDSFLLRTTGAQRWASENSAYEGSCTSRFDISLSNGGQVWLELWWMYTVRQRVDRVVAALFDPPDRSIITLTKFTTNGRITCSRRFSLHPYQ